MDFKEWLKVEKKYTDRYVSDTLSRLQRVKRILNIKLIEENSEEMLEENEEFKKLSYSVKSQLRRAIRAYLNFKGELKND